MAEPTPQKQLPKCPKCGSARTRRSRRDNPKESVLRNLLFQTPYRCRACDHRFFGFRVARSEPDAGAAKPLE
jgi:DNA-directed RNA polymerase subunit RPC12/RpoP